MSERYVVIEQVGGGGFADVYKARDTWTGQIVAKKELRVPNHSNRQRFRRERDMYGEQSQNRHVIDLFDSDTEAAAPYLILKFAPLGSLQQFVTNRQDPKRVAQWFCDILVGLSPVYKEDGFHGDPKPSNFLLFQEDREFVVLIDFGLAQRPNTFSGPMTRSPRGTPDYQDPALDKGYAYTWRSDIYALGISLRELLTGNRSRDIYAEFRVPMELRNLIDEMIDPVPQNRPTPRRIYQTLQTFIQKPEPVAVEAQPIGVGGLIAALAGVALVALATSNNYDSKVGRYRDGNGRFASGRWG